VIRRVDATGRVIPGMCGVARGLYQTVVARCPAKNDRINSALAHACAVGQMPGSAKQAALAWVATHHGDSAVA
jgi:hypothetical protein